MIEKIGQKVMVGFHGTTPDDLEVKQIIKLAEKGLIGGVILFGYNIKSKQQVTTLIAALKAKAKHPLIVAVDQEGGKVQRLAERNGFTNYKTAYEIAQTMTPSQAEVYYEGMAKELKSVGFNCNFGPVTDMHHDNPVIGGLKRAYSHDPDTIANYAIAFIKAHKKHGIITSLKHYPGHGFATKDSHKGLVDITNTHATVEKLPFKKLIAKGFNGMVMVGHLMHRDVDSKYPASLSKVMLQDWLRQEDGFKGVIITDDLHMGAIQAEFGFSDTVISAVKAGVDILLYSNNIGANQSDSKFDPKNTLAVQIVKIINNAIKTNQIPPQLIDASYRRIMKLKGRLD